SLVALEGYALQEYFFPVFFSRRRARRRKALEHHVDRQRPQRIVRRLAELVGDAGDELVTAIDDAGVEPAAGNVGGLQRGLEVDWFSAAGRQERQRECGGTSECAQHLSILVHK